MFAWMWEPRPRGDAALDQQIIVPRRHSHEIQAAHLQSQQVLP
jgi:hypothetical protein